MWLNRYSITTSKSVHTIEYVDTTGLFYLTYYFFEFVKWLTSGNMNGIVFFSSVCSSSINVFHNSHASIVQWANLCLWWRHQMETFFRVTGHFPTQRPVTRSFDVFFDRRLDKRLIKQSWGWWFETLSCPLWRHYNGYRNPYVQFGDKLMKK